MRLWTLEPGYLCPGEERSFPQDLLALFGPLLRSDPQLLPMSVRLANFMNKKQSKLPVVKGVIVPNLDMLNPQNALGSLIWAGFLFIIS
jgi:hypothetical protein